MADASRMGGGSLRFVCFFSVIQDVLKWNPFVGLENVMLIPKNHALEKLTPLRSDNCFCISILNFTDLWSFIL